MKTYKEAFSQLNRAALIPFFVIGDPDFETSLEIVKTAIDSGADVLELGIPFSDPIADGPVIQKADIRAMKSGLKMAKALEFINKIKEYKDIPIGLLMYYNLVFQYGIEKFFIDCHKAGVNSVLVADLSIDDSDEISGAALSAGLDTVFMVTPNTKPDRMELIASKTTGFIYAVSVLGVTGSRNELSSHVEGLVAKIKSITDVPICVGFGISSPEHAVSVAKAGANGVIIGSKIVGFVEKNLNDKTQMKEDISVFLKSVKSALSDNIL
ncbi:MAG: tryptophan synthase subunit alpha [Sedimentisphaerales bacterium]|nr:tryptophan synthase subunit alpha [Sedimentisphaerales bacterium]